MEQMPGALLAPAAGLRRRDLFQTSIEERADVPIGDALKLPA
jgi:hypothetical protein